MRTERIGFAVCGSFCTHEQVLEALKKLTKQYETVIPIVSEISADTDTRFGTSQELLEKLEKLTGRKPLQGIAEVEPIGPKGLLDVLVIAPATGNTLAKLAHGITDTPVCMAAKAHLRADRPLLLALASNDAMSANLENIAAMLKRKAVYFVPMRQDDPAAKPHSLVADFDCILAALAAAEAGKQLRPLFV